MADLVPAHTPPRFELFRQLRQSLLPTDRNQRPPLTHSFHTSLRDQPGLRRHRPPSGPWPTTRPHQGQRRLQRRPDDIRALRRGHSKWPRSCSPPRPRVLCVRGPSEWRAESSCHPQSVHLRRPCAALVHRQTRPHNGLNSAEQCITVRGDDPGVGDKVGPVSDLTSGALTSSG